LIYYSTEIYTRDWLNRNEAHNFAQKHDTEVIKAEKRKEVEGEVANSQILQLDLHIFSKIFRLSKKFLKY
jgi:hypothetical protein